jgi:hypothetical protein
MALSLCQEHFAIFIHMKFLEQFLSTSSQNPFRFLTIPIVSCEISNSEKSSEYNMKRWLKDSYRHKCLWVFVIAKTVAIYQRIIRLEDNEKVKKSEEIEEKKLRRVLIMNASQMTFHIHPQWRCYYQTFILLCHRVSSQLANFIASLDQT